MHAESHATPRRGAAMTAKRWPVGLLGLLLAATAPAIRADEPKIYGRTLADWLKMLESDPKPDRRQAALSAIEVFGGKSREAILGVGKAVRKDADEEVRRAAAQLLGSLGAD